jgi:hypothetical protein
VTVCCLGVISSFFLDVSVSIPYNVTVSNGTDSWTEMVNGTFNGLSANTPAGISDLFYSNLYPNYKQVGGLSPYFCIFFMPLFFNCLPLARTVRILILKSASSLYLASSLREQQVHPYLHFNFSCMLIVVPNDT